MKNEFMHTDGNGAINFVKMGCDINDSNYDGDIGNHRVRSYIEYNGVKLLIEVVSISTFRTKHSVTNKELKKPIKASDNNGIFIEIFGIYQNIEKSCTGKFFMHEEEKLLFSKNTRELHSITTHKKINLLYAINNALKTNFDAINIL